jgi:hypothetical protein
MSRIPRRPLYLGSLALLCLSLSILAPGQTAHAPDGGFQLIIDSIDIPTVPGAPFSATVRTEVVRRLEDGSILMRKNHRLVARDSSGRVFQERRALSPDDDKAQSRLTSLEFRNPVSHEIYRCDPQGRVCHVFQYNSQPPEANEPTPPPDSGIQVTRIAIGQEVISGVETTGSRQLTTIAANLAATNRPITVSKEFWYSPQLGINIVVKRFDPRSGTQNFLVDELVVGEPNPTMLEPPAGATILRTARQEPTEQ